MSEIKRRRGQRKISAWSRGEKRNAQGLTLAEIGRAQFLMINSRRRLLKKCSAKAKSTGERCGQLAMENGKCRFHGGKTPRGDDWHVIQPNVSGHKTSMRRFDLKLQKAQKMQAALRRKLRAATDQERANYEKWIWAHPPGSEKLRAARRLDRRIKRHEKILPQVVEMLPDDETQALIDRIAELKARRASLEAHITGVFA